MLTSNSAQPSQAVLKVFPYVETCVALIFLAMIALIAQVETNHLTVGNLILAIIFGSTFYQMRNGEVRHRVNESIKGLEGNIYVGVIGLLALAGACLPLIFKMA